MLPRALFVSCNLLIAQVAHAGNLGEGLAFTDTCLGAIDLTEIEAAIDAQGWTAAMSGDDALIDGLAWIGVSQYFVGDTGGERVETIYDLKTKSAHGLMRKIDIPQSKNRFFLRDETTGKETLHVMWRQPVPDVTEVECRAALRPSTLEQIRAQVGTQDLPTFAPLNTLHTEGSRLDVTLMNSVGIESMSAPDAIVTTYRQVKTEKVTQ